jgi:hypothetical protein
MPGIVIPKQFLYYRNLSNHGELKNKIMSEISKLESKYKDITSGVENAHTSYQTKDLLEMKEDNKFLVEDYILKSVVGDTIKELGEYIDEFNFLPKPQYEYLNVDNAWYTKYDKYGGFDFHTHYQQTKLNNDKMHDSLYSIIYILNDPNEKNSTVFVCPENVYLPNLNTTTIDTSCFGDIKEGSVLIFPSTFLHKVEKIELPGRITISYNISGVR